MKILVVRTDRIGDLIVSTPVFKAIKDAYPDSHVTAMVSPYTKDLLLYNPYVDEIILCDRKGEHSGLSKILGLSRELKKRRFDAAVTLHSRFHLGLMLFLAGIPLRIAPATQIAQIFYNRRIRQRRSRCLKHEADYNLDLLAALDIKNPARQIGLWTAPEHDEKALKYLKEEGLETASENGKLICLHPGCGDSAKNWKPLRYAELGDLLIEKGYTVMLSGGKGEETLVEEVRKNMKKQPRIYRPQDLLSFAAVLKRVSLFVSSSTGPMHMAAAVGRPTVALFCPIRVCTPVRWGPLGESLDVFMPDVPQCETCTKDQCPHYECMDKISVGAVADAAVKLSKL